MKNIITYSAKFRNTCLIALDKKVIDFLENSNYINKFKTHNELWDAQSEVGWLDSAMPYMVVKFQFGEFIMELNEDTFSLISKFYILLDSMECFISEFHAYEALGWKWYRKYIIPEGENQGVYDSFQIMINSNNGKVPPNYIFSEDETEVARYIINLHSH